MSCSPLPIKDLDYYLDKVPEEYKQILMETFILGTQEKHKLYFLCGYCDGQNRHVDGYHRPAYMYGFSEL